MKNEEKQTVSYSEESSMPLLPTTAAVSMAIEILKDPTKVQDAEFEADDKFLAWWKKEHNTDKAPTQSELNNHIAEVVQECRLASDEEVRKSAIQNKHGLGN